ncbi:hypothetical protein [Glycomyces rhizosphaerae]|uniref:Uncharacterized protein n=1 Tax=Glycomyces rhizosphaerae TaxID=2054422 RepID=A0ABV7PY06_9ACTN
MTEAITHVAAHRQTLLAPLSEVLDGYAELAQARWRAWRRKQRLDDRLPERFYELLDAVIGFADPAVNDKSTTGPGAARQQWQPH